MYKILKIKFKKTGDVIGEWIIKRIKQARRADTGGEDSLSSDCFLALCL